jgi:7,8-dihydropterin-6-yl-methyl-4-(beta-D-ribofuranosyl)aminobenzene 5'-phosphate synthase
MKLTIIYDNEIFTEGKQLQSNWGFSCLVETEETTLLFDTGDKGGILFHNMNILQVKPQRIEHIVLSHDHHDHTGGLPSLLRHLKKPPIIHHTGIQPPTDSLPHLIESRYPYAITNDIHSTGRLPGTPVDEQSLILKGTKGLYVLVGCSHSGVDHILEAASQYGIIRGLIGGLHDFKDFSLLNDLELICPCHCTTFKQRIADLYPETATKGGVGKTLDL